MKLTIKNWQFYPTPPDGVYLLKDWVEARNYEQLKLLWVLYTFVEKESLNDRDFLHEMMKKKFLSTKKMVKLGKSRNFVVKVWSTSNLNKKEMSEFYTKVENFFREIGYILPPYDSVEYQNLYESCKYF